MTATDRPLAAVRAVERQRRRRRLGGDQRIDHDDARVALDEADVGQVEAADLVDPLDNFVQALLGAQLRLTPEAGVHGRRSITGDECVGVVVPHHPAVGGLHHAGFERADEPAVGVGEVTGVGEWEFGQKVRMGGFDDGGWRLLFHSIQPATVACGEVPN